MISKKQGPGAGDTGACAKNVPTKNNRNNSQTSRRAQRKNRHRPAENRASASTRRSYAVYYGQRLLGRFVLNESTDQALAWTAARRFIGRFEGYRAAARAIGRATVTERQAAEARRRLDDPQPPFATGLPEHFLRRDR